MRKPSKPISISRIITYVIVGSTVATKAAASMIVPFWTIGQPNQTAVWSNLRSEFEQPEDSGKLDPNLVALVETASYGEDFEEAVRLSYTMVSAGDVGPLDTLWIDTLIRKSGSDTIERFLTIRSSIDSVVLESREDYMERWVWKTANVLSTQERNAPRPH